MQKYSALFLEGYKLKEAARKSAPQFGIYLSAAEKFHESGVLAAATAQLAAPTSDDRTKREAFSSYALYEEQNCLANYYYEQRDCAVAREYLEKALGLLRTHFARIDDGLKHVSSNAREYLARMRGEAKVHERFAVALGEAISAKEAWDGGRFVDALDHYRGIVDLFQQLLTNTAEALSPVDHRIATGNLRGAIMNISNSMVMIHYTLEGVHSLESPTLLSYDLARDLVRHLLTAYREGMAAFTANPEWEQYREQAINCRRAVEQLVNDNKHGWPQLYSEFRNDSDFVSVLGAIDLDRLRALERGDSAMRPSLRILFMAASPEDQLRIRTDKEAKRIDEALRKTKHSGHVAVLQAHAMQIADLQDTLLRHEPHIVHFSGHGNHTGELLFEDFMGQTDSSSPNAIEATFKLLKDNVRGVVLNACHSGRQAEAIAQYVAFVVGMSGSIDDDAAIAFAVGFYRALGYGKSVKEAFDLGRNEIDLQNLSDQNVPKLYVRPGDDPDQIVLVP